MFSFEQFEINKPFRSFGFVNALLLNKYVTRGVFYYYIICIIVGYYYIGLLIIIFQTNNYFTTS
jgi:hypothetical protein